MIQINDKTLCCGCTACAGVCPKNCIAITSDQEGFSYPIADASICIECGKCERVCPFLNPKSRREALAIYAANNKDTDIRLQSSSGGLFTLLAEQMIRHGGVVFGARFDENWQVVISYTETIEGIAQFRGSKYVQSRVDNAYHDARSFLKEGRSVLFSGSPCQIAGLNHFLQKKYSNLITLDYVCHGAPSPLVWSKYLDNVTKEHRHNIKMINFRDKTNGWHKYNFVIEMDKTYSNLSVHTCHRSNLYMQAFLSNLILRPSCHKCLAKEGRSMSDLSIADYWGVEHLLPKMDDDKGTSMLFINSEHGKDIIDWAGIVYDDIAITSEVESYNQGLSPIAAVHKNRKRFFKQLEHNLDILRLISHELKPTLAQRLVTKLKRIVAG